MPIDLDEDLRLLIEADRSVEVRPLIRSRRIVVEPVGAADDEVESADILVLVRGRFGECKCGLY